MQKAYSRYESANEEAYCCNQSSLVCPEDKKEAIGLANAAFAEFKRLVFERLKVNGSSTMIVRETPEDGYKDFNDELLSKLNYGLRESTGNEEVKHNGLKR